MATPASPGPSLANSPPWRSVASSQPSAVRGQQSSILPPSSSLDLDRCPGGPHHSLIKKRSNSEHIECNASRPPLRSTYVYRWNFEQESELHVHRTFCLPIVRASIPMDPRPAAGVDGQRLTLCTEVTQSTRSAPGRATSITLYTVSMVPQELQAWCTAIFQHACPSLFPQDAYVCTSKTSVVASLIVAPKRAATATAHDTTMILSNNGLLAVALGYVPRSFRDFTAVAPTPC